MSESDGRSVIKACTSSRRRKAWEEFRVRFEPAMRAGVVRAFRRAGLVPRREVVEDLVQESYCRLLERDRRALGQCASREDRGIGAYIGRIAERRALDYLRAETAKKRGAGRVDSLETIQDLKGERTWLGVAAEAENRLLGSELKRQLLVACRRWGGRRRERNERILRLAFFEGLTSREIQERLGDLISANGIDTVLHRARKRLAEDGLGLAGKPFGKSRSPT